MVSTYSTLLSFGGWGVLAIIVYWILMYVIVVSDDRTATTTLAWLVILFTLPLIGLIIYFFFGRDWSRSRRFSFRADLERMTPFMTPIYERYRPLQKKLEEHNAGGFEGKIDAAIRELNLAEPLPVTTFEDHPSGEAAFARLLADLGDAKRFIHMQYFIWEQDELTAKITEILSTQGQGGRRGPHHVRLGRVDRLQEGRAQGARRRGRAGPCRREGPDHDQLPQPPQDHRRSTARSDTPAA